LAPARRRPGFDWSRAIDRLSHRHNLERAKKRGARMCSPLPDAN
jgi:hypothetical protein